MALYEEAALISNSLTRSREAMSYSVECVSLLSTLHLQECMVNGHPGISIIGRLNPDVSGAVLVITGSGSPVNIL